MRSETHPSFPCRCFTPILQLGVLQTVSIAYEYTMLCVCNAQRLRAYGVFLALPSATNRAMASRPCQVDDEEAEEVDEDEAAMQVRVWCWSVS